ncbi:MAG TPA: nitronate monooxygenase [Spirochaetota bacterium]|nr:nitronate monooxygenase [Spirochaetota bacterium]HQO01220.1 nitronate monooxygenase [Spirochaetota bacterium]HQP47915.1 nitronate monooxygenase [Spirochaetota bacterium]
MKTAITEMFGVEYPIICGAMMWLCTPKLCAAISNAGGLGNLTAGNYPTEEEFRNAINETRSMTDKPFMVNVTILPSVHIGPEQHKMYLRVCAQEKIAGLEISGAPLDKAVGMEIVDLLKKAGVKLFHKVGSVRHAEHAVKAGYDGIYAAGIEEGGHPLNDDVTTMVLTPRIKDVCRVPVVTVGGIADGRSMAAAMVLGADGVMMATRFVATQECEVHENIKQHLIKRHENDTALICKSIGLQGRAIRNKVVEDVLALEAKGCGFEELLPLIAGKKVKEAWETGNVDLAPMMMGQSVGLVNDVPSCRELIERMVREAKEEISRVSGLL